MALYLEQYLDHLQTLPGEVQRNLRLIHELDEKVASNVDKLNELGGQWAKDEERLSADERRKRKDEILALLSKAKSLSEEKWQISMQLYEMVDKHIRRLDNELARFERDLKRKVMHAKLDMVESGQSSTEGGDRKGTSQQQTSDKCKTQKGARRGHTTGEESSASENAPPSKTRKKKRKTTGAEDATAGASCRADSASGPLSPGVEQLATLSGAALIQQLVGVGAGVMDMPVDPNEPVYCTCRQVSYGEMVGCDNPDCHIEWFHFGCVALTTKPKGKWFCPMCKEALRKKASPSR